MTKPERTLCIAAPRPATSALLDALYVVVVSGTVPHSSLVLIKVMKKSAAQNLCAWRSESPFGQ